MEKRAEMALVIPVLPARNVSEAVRFYVDRLGFELRFTDREDDPQYAGVRRGNAMLHLQFQYEKDFQAGSAGRCVLRVVVDDPDALCEEYKKKGVVKDSAKPEDTSWNTREFDFADPNGNMLVFLRAL
jgi:uncharacterized glyoxalase superfamily protein PhnB